MAMINNIRKQKKFLFVIIVIAMLLFLVPYQAIMSFLGQGVSNAGEINGVTVTQQEFQKSLQNRESLNLRYRDNTALSDAVWSELVDAKLFEGQYAELGIEVSEDELEEIMFGDNISKFVENTFYQNGINDDAREQIRTYIDGLSPSVANEFRRMISNNRKQEKWDALVNKGVYANPIDAQIDYEFKNDKVNFEYVYKKYADIDDSEISFDETDVRAYYNKHKGEDKYTQKDERDIDYVEFAVFPSKTDSSDIKRKINNIAIDWRNDEDDSSFFMKTRTESSFYQPTPYKDGDYASINDTMLLAPKGALFGPFLHKANPRSQEATYTIAKVTDIINGPDSIDAQIIMLRATSPDIEPLKIKMDSIKQLITSGAATFEEMALQFNADIDQQTNLPKTSSAYKDITRGNYGILDDVMFNKPVGTIEILDNQSAVFLVEVLKQNEPKRITMIASISRKITASTETMKLAYKKAESFRNENRDAESFLLMGDSLFAMKTWDGINNKSKSKGNITDGTKLVNWANNTSTKVGDVSTPKKVKGMYIVAHLNAIKEKGIPEFKHVKEEMELEVIKEKKYELYAEKMNGNSLEEIATAIEGKKAVSSNTTKATGTIQGVSGKEAMVIGFAFAIPEGEISNPIQGETGIWVIAPTGTTDAEAKDQYVTEQATLQNSQLKSFAVRNAIRKSANIDDTRLR